MMGDVGGGLFQGERKTVKEVTSQLIRLIEVLRG